jgi:5S rRNA maturation endonuclease (ribonuclease M5)
LQEGGPPSVVTTTKKYKPEYVRAAFSEWHVGDEGADGEQRIFCPLCENPATSKSPSASMNAAEGIWNCLKGNHGGSIYELVQELKHENGWDIRSAAMKGKHSDSSYSAATTQRLNESRGGVPLPDEEKISSWTEKLLNNRVALKRLQDLRGLDRKTIVECQLGFDGERYTIPVRTAEGELINVRRYKPGVESAQKMLNLTGHGSAAIYRADILRDNEAVVITEGEMDCILLNQYGIPAVTQTGGAGTFKPQFAPSFADKTVWICYDNDDAGRQGARKVERVLSAFAQHIYIIDIGSVIPTKGGDITDYLHLEGHTAEDFQGLMDATVESQMSSVKARRPLAEGGEPLSLNDSMAQANQSKTIELVVSIAGKQQEPYTVPKVITATCDQSKGQVCNFCPIAARNGQAEFDVRKDDENLFRFVDVTEQRRRALIKELTGARCSDRVEFEIDENYHVEELLVQPSVDDRKDNETQQPVRRTAFAVGTHSSTVNRKVRMVGKNVSDPKTGKLRFMSWVNEPVEMDIDKFQLTPELRERLKAFQPSEDQSPLEKCFEIAGDMADNVTHIYGRDILHVAYDLVYHSVISFKVYDMPVDKGWLEMAVVGDTRTGKSEIAHRLINHYRSGVLHSCEGSSFAGIVGGVQQIDGRWHMTWGVVPMNDRRLVVLDEASGLMDKNVIEQMSSIRSSGVAQITKIAAEETSARTRLIWVLNPGDGSMLKDHTTAGIGALRTVVPNAEDIARFDFVIATAKGDVDSKIINSGFGEQHSPVYSSEDSEALIKWAWSLTRQDVIISEAAANAAVKAAMDMGERYVADPPLVQSENVRFKILRVAAAIAARTFSVSERGKLRVNAEHVRDAVSFLDKVYEQEALGYARISRRQIEAGVRAQEKRAICKTYLEEHRDDVLLTLRMVGGNNFRVRDFVEFGSMSQEAAKQTVNQLLRWQLVQTKTRGDIGMSATLVAVVRELEEED